MTYMNAELELVRFDAEDVLATSTTEETEATGCGAGQNWVGEDDEF